MGYAYTGQCKECGLEFDVNDGGGFLVRQLRCEVCGREKLVGLDEIEQAHKALMERLITEEEYQLKVEEKAGRCKCGGHHRFNAPIRCPKCKSTEIEDTGKNGIYYD